MARHPVRRIRQGRVDSEGQRIGKIRQRLGPDRAGVVDQHDRHQRSILGVVEGCGVTLQRGRAIRGHTLRFVAFGQRLDRDADNRAAVGGFGVGPGLRQRGDSGVRRIGGLGIGAGHIVSRGGRGRWRALGYGRRIVGTRDRLRGGLSLRRCGGIDSHLGGGFPARADARRRRSFRRPFGIRKRGDLGRVLAFGRGRIKTGAGLRRRRRRGLSRVRDSRNPGLLPRGVGTDGGGLRRDRRFPARRQFRRTRGLLRVVQPGGRIADPRLVRRLGIRALHRRQIVRRGARAARRDGRGLDQVGIRSGRRDAGRVASRVPPGGGGGRFSCHFRSLQRHQQRQPRRPGRHQHSAQYQTPNKSAHSCLAPLLDATAPARSLGGNTVSRPLALDAGGHP